MTKGFGKKKKTEWKQLPLNEHNISSIDPNERWRYKEVNVSGRLLLKLDTIDKNNSIEFLSTGFNFECDPFVDYFLQGETVTKEIQKQYNFISGYNGIIKVIGLKKENAKIIITLTVRLVDIDLTNSQDIFHKNLYNKIKKNHFTFVDTYEYVIYTVIGDTDWRTVDVLK